MRRMILLGVGTAVPDADRECTHMVWDAPGGPLLIDAGGSAYARLLRAGLDPQGLRGIVLTHSHADHIYGFPILLSQLFLAGRTEAIPVYGTLPTLQSARALWEASQIADYSVPVRWIEVEAGGDLPLEAAYRVRTAATEHFRPCLALRLEEPDGSRAVVYSADTQPCPAVTALAKGAAVLIHEATARKPQAGHTTPRQAGEVAAHAGVGRLVLVHFSPRWTMAEAEALAEVRAAGYSGPAEIGQELQVIEVGETGGG
jgi:ribonuclease Z